MRCAPCTSISSNSSARSCRERTEKFAGQVRRRRLRQLGQLCAHRQNRRPGLSVYAGPFVRRSWKFPAYNRMACGRTQRLTAAACVVSVRSSGGRTVHEGERPSVRVGNPARGTGWRHVAKHKDLLGAADARSLILRLYFNRILKKALLFQQPAKRRITAQESDTGCAARSRA